MIYNKLMSAVAGVGASLVLLGAPAAATPAEPTPTPQPTVEQTPATDAGAQAVHRKSRACRTPSGKKINISWGDGNVTTTVYYNNHCNQKWIIELEFVKQSGLKFYECVTAPARKKGNKEVGYGNPNKVSIVKSSPNC